MDIDRKSGELPRKPADKTKVEVTTEYQITVNVWIAELGTKVTTKTTYSPPSDWLKRHHFQHPR